MQITSEYVSPFFWELDGLYRGILIQLHFDGELCFCQQHYSTREPRFLSGKVKCRRIACFVVLRKKITFLKLFQSSFPSLALCRLRKMILAWSFDSKIKLILNFIFQELNSWIVLAYFLDTFSQNSLFPKREHSSADSWLTVYKKMI